MPAYSFTKGLGGKVSPPLIWARSKVKVFFLLDGLPLGLRLILKVIFFSLNQMIDHCKECMHCAEDLLSEKSRFGLTEALL